MKTTIKLTTSKALTVEPCGNSDLIALAVRQGMPLGNKTTESVYLTPDQAAALVVGLEQALEMMPKSSWVSLEERASYYRAQKSKDSAAVIEIDRVMLCAGQHWPDVPGEAMIVRHVKFLTRILNAELKHKEENALVQAVDRLRHEVQISWMTGVDDFRNHYDAPLLTLLGCQHFQDLCDKAAA